MQLAPTEHQSMIRDAARSFLADVSGSAAVRAAVASESGFDDAVWHRIRGDLGWCALPIAEDHGGLGLGAVELGLLCEEMGRHLLCAPFFSAACLAANLLAECGSEPARARFLPGLADGSLRATVPLGDSPGDCIDDGAGLRARREDGRWRLDGNCPRVPDAPGADWLFVCAQIDAGGAGLFAVPRETAGLTLKPLATWDATRRFAAVEFDALRLPADSRLDDPLRAAQGLRRSAALARLYLAAEQLGGAQACLDVSVAYVQMRRQFGRSIASFQAVKHRCAQMMVRVEALRSAVYGCAALAVADDDAALALECAAARALSAETFFYCAQEAIQLHGGLGFTWDCDLQLYFKRAQAGSRWLGAADALRERVAVSLLDAVA